MDTLSQMQYKMDELAQVFLSALARVVTYQAGDPSADEASLEQARMLAKTLVAVSQDMEALISDLPDNTSTAEEQRRELQELDRRAIEMTDELRVAVQRAERRAERIREILRSLAHDCIHSATLAST